MLIVNNNVVNVNNVTYNNFKVYFMKTVTIQLLFIEIESTE